MTGEAALNDEEVFFFPPSKNIWSSSASQPCMTNISVTEKTQVISGKGGREERVLAQHLKKKHNILLFNMCKHLWFGSKRENLISSNLGLEMIHPKKNWSSKKSIFVAPTAVVSV